MRKGKRPLAKARYLGPKTAEDINLASWNRFFEEGGSLNQPAHLESGRLRELRRQLELLANLHGGNF